jgi:hypothetical protein
MRGGCSVEEDDDDVVILDADDEAASAQSLDARFSSCGFSSRDLWDAHLLFHLFRYKNMASADKARFLASKFGVIFEAEFPQAGLRSRKVHRAFTQLYIHAERFVAARESSAAVRMAALMHAYCDVDALRATCPALLAALEDEAGEEHELEAGLDSILPAAMGGAAEPQQAASAGPGPSEDDYLF